MAERSTNPLNLPAPRDLPSRDVLEGAVSSGARHAVDLPRLGPASMAPSGLRLVDDSTRR